MKSDLIQASYGGPALTYYVLTRASRILYVILGFWCKLGSPDSSSPLDSRLQDQLASDKKHRTPIICKAYNCSPSPSPFTSMSLGRSFNSDTHRCRCHDRTAYASYCDDIVSGGCARVGCAGDDSLALLVSDGAAGRSHADSDNCKTEQCSPFSAVLQRKE